MSATSTMTSPAAAFTERQRWTYLGILLLIATSCYADRAVVGVLLEPLKREFGLTDIQLGFLTGPPFAICYALASIPLGRLADATSRKNVLICSLTAWTVMTGLCGFATGLTMLIICRMGVGASEGSAIPSGHALLADYFTPERRTLAFAVFAAAPAMGSAIANGFGGYLAEHYGWYTAFWGMSLLGVPIALAALLVLKEPARQRKAVSSPGVTKLSGDSFWTELKAILRKPSFCFTVGGSVLIASFTQGAMAFAPSLMVRTLDLSLSHTGLGYGLASLVGSLSGMVIGGLVGDRLAKRGAHLLMLMPVAGPLLASIAAYFAFTTTSPTAFVLLAMVIHASLTASLPAIYAGIQHVCGGSRRALADAVNLASVNLLGIAFGPVATGVLSELYSSAGEDSLRLSMLTMSAVLPLSALSFYMSSRYIRADAEA